MALMHRWMSGAHLNPSAQSGRLPPCFCYGSKTVPKSGHISIHRRNRGDRRECSLTAAQCCLACLSWLSFVLACCCVGWVGWGLCSCWVVRCLGGLCRFVCVPDYRRLHLKVSLWFSNSGLDHMRPGAGLGAGPGDGQGLRAERN